MLTNIMASKSTFKSLIIFSRKISPNLVLFLDFFFPPRDGFIKAIGPADVIQRQFSGETFEERIDCSGKCVLPGAEDLFQKTLERNEQ